MERSLGAGCVAKDISAITVLDGLSEPDAAFALRPSGRKEVLFR
jgi:hypothetical protein